MNNASFRIGLGVQVEDRITGFAGVVTGRADYITGCNQYLVQPRALKATGEKPAGEWFDEQRLHVPAQAEPLTLDNNKPGACESAPVK